MNTCKSMIRIVLMALLLAVCVYEATAAEEMTENGLRYTVYDTHVAVTGYCGDEETLVIPSTIAGLPVTYIVAANKTENATIENKATKTVVLPETVETLGWDSFAQMTALTKVEGLEYVQNLDGYNFGATKVTELLFSDALRDVGPGAFECEPLKKLRIPDDVTYQKDFAFSNMFRYNTELTSIELIETGNTPTLVKDGPALYTADMKTLIIYPCGYKGNLSYRIPEGVEELAINAFDIRSAYVTDGLMDVVVPASVKKVYEDTFYTGIYIMNGPDGSSEHFVMPHLHVYEDSPIASYCESMGYTYFIRGDETVTIEERIRQITAEAITAGMTDYEKAYALNEWLVNNVVYDNTLTHYTADSILFKGTGVCQSFMLTYEMLLTHAGIPSRQYFVQVGDVGHGFNSVYLNGEWCYVDTTWNNNTSSDCFFGMNVDMVGETYGVDSGFDPQGVGNNNGYQHYHPYRRGVYDEYLKQGKALVQAAVDARNASLILTKEQLLTLREEYLTDTAREQYFDAALLAAWLRDQSFGTDVYTIIKYQNDTDGISILISYGTPLPEDFEFSTAEDGIRIDRYTGSACEVTIPDTIMGMPVVEISSHAFDGCAKVTTISMPDTITNIREYAFFLCESLTKIDLSAGLVYLGDAALGDCYALETIVLPDSLTGVGNNLFFQCTSLKHVTIPDTLTAIGIGMFTSCSVLETVQLPSGMTEIPDDMFTGCDSFSAVTIPAGVKRIGKFAFVNTALDSLQLPEGLELIDQYAFLGCKLTSLTVPAAAKEIAPDAFNGSHLASVTLSEGLVTLGERAFMGSKLEHISIPATVTQIGEGCFTGCQHLASVSVAQGNQNYSAADNILYNADKTVLILSPAANSGEIHVPRTVRRIGDAAFQNNTLVTAIVFEGPLDSLGEKCFADCSALTEIAIPQGVTTLPFGCMSGCTSLISVTLPHTLTAIEGWAFMSCFQLTSLDVPDSVASIAFDAMPRNITSFRIPAAMTVLPDNLLNDTQVSKLHVHPLVTRIGLNNQPGDDPAVYGEAGSYAERYAEEQGFKFVPVNWDDGQVGWLILPSSLTRIEDGAFAGTAAVCVVIPEGCVSIGANAFAAAEVLAWVEIPGSVESIGAGAFDTGVTLIAPAGSYAWNWAETNGYEVRAK